MLKAKPFRKRKDLRCGSHDERAKAHALTSRHAEEMEMKTAGQSRDRNKYNLICGWVAKDTKMMPRVVKITAKI